MWSTIAYAHTRRCAPAHRGRAGNPRGRTPVLVCLYRTPLPNPPRQDRRPVDDPHGARPALPRPDRAPHAACGPPARPHGAAAAMVTTTDDRHALRCGPLRVPSGAVTPASMDRRHAHPPLDACPGRRGQFRPGADPAAGQRRGHAGGPEPVGGGLEARQTLAHPSRAGVGPTNKRRAPLSQRATPQRTWALGVGDEGWWSRLTQPPPHGWTDTEAPPKLQELTPPMDDADPTALAGDGRLLRPGPQQADQRGRRFVAGRPVSPVTLDCLAWCSAQRAAPGFTALRLIGDNASWHRSPAVRHWIRQPHQQVKQGAEGVRLGVCPLPRQSPGLNPREPPGVHRNRAVSELGRLLRAADLAARVYAYDNCKREAHLVMPKKVA
jgi:hypothetical protein